MDSNEWRNDELRKAKKDITRRCVEYIAELAVDLDAHEGKGVAKRVKSIECDYGILVAWLRGSSIHHYLIDAPASILERGIEPWPRGATRTLDHMNKILVAELVGDERGYERELGKMLDSPSGLRARAEREREAARRSSKKKKKSKKRRK